MKGEEWNGTDCLKCQIDHYKSVIGNNVSCEICPMNETAPDVGYSACGKIISAVINVFKKKHSISHI